MYEAHEEDVVYPKCKPPSHSRVMFAASPPMFHSPRRSRREHRVAGGTPHPGHASRTAGVAGGGEEPALQPRPLQGRLE